MAVMWLGLTAEKAGVSDNVTGDSVVNTACSHETEKFLLVHAPVSVLTAVTSEHSLRGCEDWQMNVFDSANLAKEILQVVLFAQHARADAPRHEPRPPR